MFQRKKINAQDSRFYEICPPQISVWSVFVVQEPPWVTSTCLCHIFLLPMNAAFVILPFTFPFFNPFLLEKLEAFTNIPISTHSHQAGKNLKRSDFLGPQNRRPSWGKSKILGHQTLKLHKCSLFITSTLTFLPHQACSNTYSPHLSIAYEPREKIHETWTMSQGSSTFLIYVSRKFYHLNHIKGEVEGTFLSCLLY